ncbi:MAG: type II toxin-antitoxin system VapC family toxin [Chloroflexi bacterium]|nr:type II toxin-antitoxin system VapC family toxin [Chloroflexota bacterium]
MKAVLDASVIVKWLFADPDREELTTEATVLMNAVVEGRIAAMQPPHWLAEVGAVLARATPRTAEHDIIMLCGLNLEVMDEPQVMQRACRLSISLNQHLFDTLYHAVALEQGATLISADRHYYRKAHHLGQIVYLADWQPT